MTLTDTKVGAATTITVTPNQATSGMITGDILAGKHAESAKVRIHIIEYPVCTTFIALDYQVKETVFFLS